MSTPPTSYHVTGRGRTGGEASIRAADHDIPIDASWASETPSGFPGPAELLVAAFAACLLKNMERAATLLPFRYERVEVDVVARRQEAPPRFVELTYEVRVVTDEDPRRVELLHRNLSQFGTIYNTLAASCDVHGTVVAVPPHP